MGSALSGIREMAAGARRILADVGQLPVDEIGPVLRELQETRRAWDCLEALLAARVGERVTPMPVKDLLDGTPGDVARRVKRADVAAALPALSTGWGEGSVSVANVDAVAATLGRLSNRQKARLAEQDEALARAAATESGDVFSSRLEELERQITGIDLLARRERLRARRFHKKWFDQDGCLNGRYRLDPDDSVRANAALEVEMTRRYAQGRDDRTLAGASDLIREQCGADALASLLIGDATAGSAPGGMVVIADPARLETDDASVPGELAEEPGASFPDGTSLPLEVARRVLCDSDLWLVRAGDRREVLDLHRRARTASQAQRAVLALMHPTCAVPDCEVPFEFCQIHHVTFWDHGGVTNLANMVPVCNHHHRLIHDHHWRLELHPDHGRTLLSPTGETVAHSPPPSPTVLARLPDQYAWYRHEIQEASRARKRLAAHCPQNRKSARAGPSTR